MAADRVNVLTPAEQAPGDRPRPLELWDGPRPELWSDDRGYHPGLCVGLLRTDNTGTTPRLVSGCLAQKWGQTGPSTAPSGGEWLFCPAPLLGGGLARSHLSASRPRHGRLDARTTLHDPLDQRRRARLCYPRGLAHRRRHATRGLASALGSPLRPPPGPCARGLDRDCPGRPGVVCPLALSHDASARVASLFTYQSPRRLSR